MPRTNNSGPSPRPSPGGRGRIAGRATGKGTHARFGSLLSNLPKADGGRLCGMARVRCHGRTTAAPHPGPLPEGEGESLAGRPGRELTRGSEVCLATCQRQMEEGCVVWRGSDATDEQQRPLTPALSRRERENRWQGDREGNSRAVRKFA